MKRSDFLKKIGLCAIIAPFAPKILAEILPKGKSVADLIKSAQGGLTPNDFKDPGWIIPDKDGRYHHGYRMGETRFVGIRYWDKGGNSHTVLA